MCLTRQNKKHISHSTFQSDKIHTYICMYINYTNVCILWIWALQWSANTWTFGNQATGRCPNTPLLSNNSHQDTHYNPVLTQLFATIHTCTHKVRTNAKVLRWENNSCAAKQWEKVAPIVWNKFHTVSQSDHWLKKHATESTMHMYIHTAYCAPVFNGIVSPF